MVVLMVVVKIEGKEEEGKEEKQAQEGKGWRYTRSFKRR